jgi:Alpha/beta hydrolase domain
MSPLAHVLLRSGPTSRPATSLGGRAVGRLVGVCLLVSLGMTGFAPGATAGDVAQSQLSVPAATLSPVRVPGTGAMAASAVDLPRSGYAEREFYATGRAHRYRGAVSGAQTDAQVIDDGWDYRTRVLVRWPSAKRFNGTLVVEWFNVTAGQDVDFAWAESFEYLLREGYAVAAVSAQRVGVERLKTWSPQRYGDLTVAADNNDPNGGLVDPTNDPLSWDIMAQVSQALKVNAAPVRPLPGLSVRRVIAIGESQSAGRLTVYYNTIHPLHRFFDGFVYLDRAGQLRADQPTPAVSVNSEALSFLPVATGSEYVRYWEVAGASHATFDGAQYVDAMVLRDQSFPGPSGPISFTQLIESTGCGLLPLFSTVDYGLVLNAAIDSVDRWIRSGRAAPASSFFERGADGQLVRDANGRVVGGVHISHYDAPTDFIVARNTGSVFCQLSGHHRPFTADELERMYGTHRAYVIQVIASDAVALRGGYLLPFDAAAVLRTAVNSDVAR